MLTTSLPRRRWRALAAALLALAVTTSSAAAQIAVVGSTVEEYTASPGQRYVRTIVVRNLTQQTQPVRVYQTDYSFSADGVSTFDSAGTTARSNATWITPAVGSLLVPPASEMSVTYTVDVPNGALTGTYWSAVMVEGAPTDAARSSPGQPRVGLGAVMRYAVQVATHIRDTGTRTIAFENSKVLADSAQRFELDVINTGERAYRPALWIEVYDEKGALRANARQERGLLYPGSSLKQIFRLGNLPPGGYRAIVFADSGEDAVFASQFTLKF